MSSPTKDFDALPRVIAVAIKYSGLLVSLPPPFRHHNIAQGMTGLGVSQDMDAQEQGFLLSDGTFASRTDAKFYASYHNQILPDRGKLSELYSEDLW